MPEVTPAPCTHPGSRGASFCPRCGADLRRGDHYTPPVCASCGLWPEAGDAFCRQCGTVLQKSPGPTAVNEDLRK